MDIVNLSNIPINQRELFDHIEKKFNLSQLKHLGTFKRGKGISNEDLKENGYPCITYGQLYTSFNGIIRKAVTHIDEVTMKNSSKSQKGDILFPGSGETLEEIGKASVNLLDETLYAGGDIIIFTPSKKINPLYLSYFLNSYLFLAQSRRLGQGHSVVHIYSKDLENIIVPVPRVEEQKKIANILSTWDRALELKIDLLSMKEKSVTEFLSIIFNYKYTEGNHSIANLISKEHKTNRKSSEGKEHGAYPFFTNSTEDYHKYLDEHDFDGEYIIINTGGKAYFDYYNGTFSAMSDCYIISTKSAINTKYFFYLLKRMEKYINYVGFNGSGLKHLDKKWFKKQKVNLPDINIQMKIVDYLDSLNREISLLKSEIIMLRQQKKGLMQQLLTGKIRVQS